MGYDKGKLSREHIVEAGTSVVLAKGFSATTMADLTQASHTSAGKLTHHFPTRAKSSDAVTSRHSIGKTRSARGF